MKASRFTSVCFAITAWFAASPAYASCEGSFPNPITDICWECAFPWSIGPVSISIGAKFPDTDNPSFPICFCKGGGFFGLPRIGISTGFWEPLRIIDVTNTPYCFPGLGGITFGSTDITKKTAVKRARGGTSFSSWHTHSYAYPVFAILSLFDTGVPNTCFDSGDLKVDYISEIDPTWLDDEITNLLTPENILVATPIAQAACAADCIAANVGLPLQKLFWCAGCQGSLLPLSGNIPGHIGNVQASLLAVQKTAARLTRVGILKGGASNGGSPLCTRERRTTLQKSEWRTQMVYPTAMASGSTAANPFGRSSVHYEAGKDEILAGGHYAYFLWGKRNCCAP